MRIASKIDEAVQMALSIATVKKLCGGAEEISMILGFKEEMKLVHGLSNIISIRVATKGIPTKLLNVPIIAVKNTKKGSIASIKRKER